MDIWEYAQGMGVVGIGNGCRDIDGWIRIDKGKAEIKRIEEGNGERNDIGSGDRDKKDKGSGDKDIKKHKSKDKHKKKKSNKQKKKREKQRTDNSYSDGGLSNLSDNSFNSLDSSYSIPPPPPVPTYSGLILSPGMEYTGHIHILPIQADQYSDMNESLDDECQYKYILSEHIDRVREGYREYGSRVNTALERMVMETMGKEARYMLREYGKEWVGMVNGENTNRGRVLLLEGKDTDRIYYIDRGEVMLHRREMRQTVPMRILSTGQIVGAEMSVLTRSPYTALCTGEGYVYSLPISILRRGDIIKANPSTKSLSDRPKYPHPLSHSMPGGSIHPNTKPYTMVPNRVPSRIDREKVKEQIFSQRKKIHDEILESLPKVNSNPRHRYLDKMESRHHPVPPFSPLRLYELRENRPVELSRYARLQSGLEPHACRPVPVIIQKYASMNRHKYDQVSLLHQSASLQQLSKDKRSLPPYLQDRLSSVSRSAMAIQPHGENEGKDMPRFEQRAENKPGKDIRDYMMLPLLMKNSQPINV